MRFWSKKKDIAEEITDDLKKVTEIAADQIAPGMGTLLLVLGAAAAGAGAYYVSQKRRQKKKAG